MTASARVRVLGPLECYVTGFTGELTAQGYTDLSIATHLRLMADLSCWLDRRQMKPAELGPDAVKRFVAKRRRTHRQLFSERGIGPLLRYLRGVEVVPTVGLLERQRRGALRGYERYLVERRAVQPTRRQAYLTIAERVLAGRGPRALTAKDVIEFIRSRARSSGLSAILTALRSILRYLFQTGKTATNLVYAVPSAPRWRLASLPKGLEKEQVAAVLASCDRRTIVGQRNFAALLLMLRLGLRAGEVAGLALDDVNWVLGEIIVRGKGGTIGRLPLPKDVGDALVRYLRCRRVGLPTRNIFLRSRAPYCSARSGTIVALARRALRAAGVDAGGAHRLRHTLATQMLRAGASLTEIAQVLRHRHIDTTAIYAKVDYDGLRTLAQPWPADDAPNLQGLVALAQPWPGGAV